MKDEENNPYGTPQMKLGKAYIYVTPHLENPIAVASPQALKEIERYIKEKDEEFKRMENAWRERLAKYE